MITYKETLERILETEIAVLKRVLAQIAPAAHAPDRKNVISPAFNTHTHGLPHRGGLERRLAWFERRLHAMRSRRVFSTAFAPAA